MGVTSSILSVASTASQFAASQQQAGGITKSAKFAADVAERQALDVSAQGDLLAGQRLQNGRRNVGAQRVAAAGSGVDANSGSAADLQGDEAHFSALDAQTIRNNAAAQAWGIRTQSGINTLAAENEASAVKQQSYNTLLTGVGNTYGIYKANRNTNAPITEKTPNVFDASKSVRR